VVAYVHSAPVSANEFQPWGGRVLVRRGAGKRVARCGGGEAGLFDRALAAQDDQGAGQGEVARHGFNGEGIELAGFDPSVSGLGVGKKGGVLEGAHLLGLLERFGLAAFV
jgi:hypothetical protein